jgi:von Willebrand factor type A domain
MIRRSVGTLRPPSPRRLRPARRRWPLAVVAIPLLAWLGWRLADDAEPSDALGPSTTETPVSTLVSFQSPIGERSTGARCWMVVIDESSSMSDADQLGTRADAVRATAEFLAAYGLDGDRIGVTWFADTADVTAAVPTDSFAASGTAPPVGSGTLISSALDTANNTMKASCGEAQPVIVLVSDGLAPTDEEFAATAAFLTGAGRDVHVHLVAMNGNQAFEQARAFWEDPALGVDSITAVDSFGTDVVAGAIAAILTAETGQQVLAK